MIGTLIIVVTGLHDVVRNGNERSRHWNDIQLTRPVHTAHIIPLDSHQLIFGTVKFRDIYPTQHLQGEKALAMLYSLSSAQALLIHAQCTTLRSQKVCCTIVYVLLTIR